MGTAEGWRAFTRASKRMAAGLRRRSQHCASSRLEKAVTQGEGVLARAFFVCPGT